MHLKNRLLLSQARENPLNFFRNPPKDKHLKNARNNELSDRRAAAAGAKTALMDAYRSAKTEAEPTTMARRAERMAIAAAREERRLERERVKLAEPERLATEVAEKLEAVTAEAEARDTREKSLIARVIEDGAKGGTRSALCQSQSMTGLSFWIGHTRDRSNTQDWSTPHCLQATTGAV
jgi:hypothetical protein